MSEDSTVCPRCERKSVDGLLCGRCLSDAHKALIFIAQHYTDVYVHRESGGGSAKRTPGSEVPITDRRAKTVAYVRNQLSTWVRELDMGDLAGLPDDPVMWALWLATRTRRIASHAAGDEAVDELVYCADLVRKAIDVRVRRRPCGKCPVCDAEVIAIGDDETGLCGRCDELGVVTQVPVLGARTDLWARLEREPMPRRLLMEALPMFGIHVKPGTFRQWVFQGRLRPVDVVDGAHRYLIGDVRDLVTRGEDAA